MQKYAQLVAKTMSELPITKQAEVYHFAQFIKKTLKAKLKKNKRTNSSVFDLFGTATSNVTDASINHDKYLYG